MNTNKDESLLFASESTIFRVVSIAKILAWVILVVYLILFIDSIQPLIQGQMTWPTEAPQILNLLANLVYAPAMGLFYFLILQGVAQGLNLGLDIYYGLHPDEDVETVAEI